MIVLALFQLLLTTLGLFPSNTVAFPRTEVEALTSFKRAIFEDPFLVLSNWNPIDSNPCNWSGVSCSQAGDHVLKLNVSHASLRGFLVPEFHLLSHLQELILHQNYLIGAIPKELCLLKNLQVLDLGSNQLTGSIPPQLGNVTSIRKFHQTNHLTGKTLLETGNLKNLKDLHLDRNKLQGSIPADSSVLLSSAKDVRPSKQSRMALCGASQLQVVDMSNNYLVGSIPECLNYVPRSSFQGNCLQEKHPLQRSPSVCRSKRGPVNAKSKPVKHRTRGSKPGWLLPLEIVTAALVVSIFTVSVFTAVQKWKATRSNLVPWMRSASLRDYNSFGSDPNVKDAAKYSRQELEVACEGFSNIIGSSTDHVVYKGTLTSGVEVAVSSISIKEENWTGYSELYFQKEVACLIKLDHKNVGKLLGYCRECPPFTRMLVFDYVSNGTLHEHLHDAEGCQLSWPRRMKIIVGIAKGLKYLHTEAHPPLTLPHLNSSCVYLTEDFSPKLMIFECWKTILARSRKSWNTQSNTVSHENGNKHAFGVMLLEIISGRIPYCKEKGSIVDWAKEYLESDVLTYMIDPELKDFRYEDLKAVCQVIKMCCTSSGSGSGSKPISELCEMLESGLSTSMNPSLGWAELQLSS